MNSNRTQRKLLLLSDVYANFAEQQVPEALRRIFRRQHGFELPTGATMAYAVSLAIHIRAISGDVASCREIREALENRASSMPQEFVVSVVYDKTHDKNLDDVLASKNDAKAWNK